MKQQLGCFFPRDRRSDLRAQTARAGSQTPECLKGIEAGGAQDHRTDRNQQLRSVGSRHDAQYLQIAQQIVVAVAAKDVIQRIGHLAAKLQRLAAHPLATACLLEGAANLQEIFLLDGIGR